MIFVIPPFSPSQVCQQYKTMLLGHMCGSTPVNSLWANPEQPKMKFCTDVKTFACTQASLATKPPKVLGKLDDGLATKIISSLAPV